MNRHLFKLFNLAKPTLKFSKNVLTMSKPAKFTSVAVSSSLLTLLYLKQQNKFFSQADAEVHEVETINASDLQDGEMKEFQVGPTKDDVILISKVDGKYHASGAKCSHFGAPLAQGVLFDNKVICPWHAASFSVTDGLPDEGPVFDGIPIYEIREHNGKLLVKVPKVLKHTAGIPMGGRKEDDHRKFVILGGGPAALSAAETLRQSGYGGEIVIVSNDTSAPYDRTLLTKNMFHLELPKITHRDQAFFDKHGISVITGKTVKSVNTGNQTVEVDGLGPLKYDKLLVATGGRARLPPVPGTDLKNVFTVRSFGDLEGIRNASKGAKNVVIVGGSFIGMETAANFKNEFKDNINVTVVDMTKTPFEKALGNEVGSVLQKYHEEKGVKFHLNAGLKSIEGSGSVKEVVLADGTKIPADLVIVGTGVRPNSEPVANVLKLAEDGGVYTDQYLQSSDPKVFAAGDVANIPYWYTGSRERIEHYNEAIQQGQIAAYNMLGKQVSHDAIPFFWTRNYDKSLQYIGFGSKYDTVHVDGNTNEYQFIAYYGLNNKVVASASMGKSPAAMIISQAMQLNVMPTLDEIKSGKVTLQDIRLRVAKKKGSSECKRRNCQHKQIPK